MNGNSRKKKKKKKKENVTTAIIHFTNQPWPKRQTFYRVNDNKKNYHLAANDANRVISPLLTITRLTICLSTQLKIAFYSQFIDTHS